MIQQALSYIADLGKKAAGAEVIRVEGMPHGVYLRHGDSLTFETIEPTPRAHQITDVDDFVDLVTRVGEGAEVYVSPVMAFAYLARDRRQAASLPLAATARFTKLGYLEPMTQKAAIALLRTELHGPHATILIPKLRRIDFSRRSAGASTAEHGKESLGRAVEMEVQQADQIPEEFDVTVPVFKTTGLRDIEATVRVAITLDMTNQNFVFTPMADAIDNAMAGAVTEVRDRIRQKLGDSVPVFMGRP